MHWPQGHPEEDGERRPAFAGLLLAVRPAAPESKRELSNDFDHAIDNIFQRNLIVDRAIKKIVDRAIENILLIARSKRFRRVEGTSRG